MLHVKVLAWAGDLSAVSFCCGSSWVLKCHSSEVELLLRVGIMHKGGAPGSALVRQAHVACWETVLMLPFLGSVRLFVLPSARYVCKPIFWNLLLLLLHFDWNLTIEHSL